MHTPSEDRSADYICFALIALSCVILRLDTIGHVYAPDNILRLIDPDSYYHLRRVLYTVRNFPRMLAFDPFLSFPTGDHVPWPPLFDFLSALLVKPFPKPENIVPALNLLYFFAAFSMLFLYVKKHHGIKAAVVAGFVLAYAGILRIYTAFGRFDHHALELLVITGIYTSFLRYQETRKIPHLLIFTFFVLCSFFIWPFAMIYTIPLIIYVLYKYLRKDIDIAIFKGLFVAFHVTAIVIAIYLRLTAVPDFPPYALKFLSGVQRDFCFIISIVFITIYLSRKMPFSPLLLWGVNLVITVLVFHNFFSSMTTALSFMSKTDAGRFFLLIEESSPPFFSTVYPLSHELDRAWFFFTPLFFLAPVIFWLHWKNHGSPLFFVYTAFFFLLTLLQFRFGYFFMLGYAVMTGEAFGKYIRKIPLIPVCIVLLVFSAYESYRDSKTIHERFAAGELYAAMKFLREHTPQKDAFEHDNAPYGILSSWDIGHFIIAVGNRPAVAHNFIGHALRNGEMKYINAMFSDSEKDVVRIMDENRSPFIVVEEPRNAIVSDWKLLSTADNPYITPGGTSLPAIMRLFLYKLFYFDGMSPDFEHTASSLRLIYEILGNPEQNKSRLKIFERVAGATIVSKGSSPALLKARIKLPGREFFYVSKGQKQSNGTVFTFPYSIDAPYDIKAAEIYLEKSGRRIPLKVTESDVQRGTTITVR